MFAAAAAIFFSLCFLGNTTPSGGLQVTTTTGGRLNRYHRYDDMTRTLKEIARNYSDFVTLHSIGQSVQRRELWVLKIKPPNSNVLGTPHVKLVGNIHGNEPVGKELIIHLASYLLENYHTNDEVKWLMDRTVIHLMPSMNPDGFEISQEGTCMGLRGRTNANAMDLNRNFPDQFQGPHNNPQPETIAVSKWLSRVPFVLSLSYHGGALVANYPYDNYPINYRESVYNVAHVTPDDDVFQNLALTYSKNHLTMHKGDACGMDFPNGITNGAQWYPLYGGMQDYNYLAYGCMEITLEVSCCKHPMAKDLPKYWKENKKAMLEFIKKAQTGVRGLIQDKTTSRRIPEALLYVSGRHVPFVSSKNGEFWRVLLPGKYVLTVAAKGYHSQSVPFTVLPTNQTYPTPTWLNVNLIPLDAVFFSNYQVPVQQTIID